MDDLLQGWIDHRTQVEIYEENARWLGDAAEFLMGRGQWDLFMTQIHSVDWAQHLYWGAIDEGHPQFDPGRAPEFLAILGRTYQLADELVGRVARAAGEDAVLVVVGDHGQELYHTTFLVNNLLAREGLLAYRRSPRTGAVSVDWSRTAAYSYGYNIYVNLQGREPGGTVHPAEYEALRERLVDLLYSARDPRTGKCPVRLACLREDMDAMGLYGEGVGDVLYALKPGYQTRTALSLSLAEIGDFWAPSELPVFQVTQLFRRHTGEHDVSFPFSKGVRTALIMAGPGVARGRRRVPVRLVDVAPTMAAFLGIPAPAQCEGALVAEAFE